MSTSQKPLKLYYTPQDHIAPEGSGLPDARNITGDAQTDAWLETLPPEERASALQEIMNPEMSAEDINELVKQGGFRFQNSKEFETWERWKKDQETSLIQDMGHAAGEVGRVFKDLAATVYKDPSKALKKGIPSIIEGAYQNLVDTYGMVAQSANPDSVFFGLKDALYGTGTVQSRMAQTNRALDFLDRSMRLYEGKETLLIDKAYIDPEITRAMTYIADPTMFIPFGGILAKGARAVGAGEVLTKAAIRANRIKANVLGGTIKWGAGAPIEAIGGALRDSIEYGIQKGAGAFEGLTGISAKETAQTVRLAGVGTATAHIAGVTVPYGGPLSTAYIGGGAAAGFGSALRMVGDQIIQRQGHRGVLSFAKEAIEETRKVGKLSPQTETFLKIIDKADPVLSYAYDMASGAAQGMFIGGVLGYLNDKKQGMAMGMGMGGVLGAGGALLGRGVADIAGSTRRMREEVTADFVLRVLKDKDGATARDLQRLRDDPRTSTDVREVMNKVIVMLDRAEEPILFRAYENSAEYKKWRDANADLGGISDAEFRNSEGWTIRRRDGNVEIGVNMENFFGADRTRQNKYAPNTVPHEFLHAVFEASVLGPHFKEMARDLMIGVRDKDGKIIQKGVLTPETVRDFMRKYVSNVATGANATERERRARELRGQVDAALDAWKKEGEVGSTTKLTPEQGALLRHLTEEMSAYYFGHWFLDKKMEFFLRGGELEGLSAMFEYIGDTWKDYWQDNLEAHAPRMRFYRNENIEAGFRNNGSRVRIGALDYFMRDVIRATSQIKKTGTLDMSRMSSGMVENLLKHHGIDDIISRDGAGRARVKPQKRYEADMAQRNAEIFRVLDSLDPSKRTSVKGPDGVIRGPFSEFELKTLVQAGLLTDGYAEKLRLIQESVDDKTKTNVMYFSYLGESMETGVGPNPPRVYGSKVAVKNRKAIVVGYNFEVDANGKGAFRIRTLDLAVIERRGKSLWMEDAVRNLWGGDHSAYMSDFYRYLANVSKPKNDPTRVPSAVLLGEGGDLKRDILHQMAGFAKADDLAYINTPLAPVPRGMMSAVTDFTVGRMFNVRGLGQRIVYEHQNAFHDIAANFKAVDLTNRYRDYSTEELEQGKRVHFDDTPYGYYELDKNGKKEYIVYMSEGTDNEIILRTNNYADVEKAFDDKLEKVLEEWRVAKDKKIEADRRKIEAAIPTGTRIAEEAKAAGDLRASETLRRILLNRGIPEQNTFFLTADEQFRLGSSVLLNNAAKAVAAENYAPYRLAANTRNGQVKATGQPMAVMVHLVVGDTEFLQHMNLKKSLEKAGGIREVIEVGKGTDIYDAFITAHSSAARAARHSAQLERLRVGKDVPATGQQVRALALAKNPLRWDGPTNDELKIGKITITDSKLQAIAYARENGHDLIVYNNRKAYDSRYPDTNPFQDRYEFILVNTNRLNDIIPLQANFVQQADGSVIRNPNANMEGLPRKVAPQDVSILDFNPDNIRKVLVNTRAKDLSAIKPEIWDSSYEKNYYRPHRGGGREEYDVRFFKPKDEADYVTKSFGEFYSDDSNYVGLIEQMEREVHADHAHVYDTITGISVEDFVRDYEEHMSAAEGSANILHAGDAVQYTLRSKEIVYNHYLENERSEEQRMTAEINHLVSASVSTALGRVFDENLAGLLLNKDGEFLQDPTQINDPKHGHTLHSIRLEDGNVISRPAQEVFQSLYIEALTIVEWANRVKASESRESAETLWKPTGWLKGNEAFVRDPDLIRQTLEAEIENRGNVFEATHAGLLKASDVLGAIRSKENQIAYFNSPEFKKHIEKISGGTLTVIKRKVDPSDILTVRDGENVDAMDIKAWLRDNDYNVEVPTIVYSERTLKFAQIIRDTTPFSFDPRRTNPDERQTYRWAWNVDRNNLRSPPYYLVGGDTIKRLQKLRQDKINADPEVKEFFEFHYGDKVTLSPSDGVPEWEYLARGERSGSLARIETAEQSRRMIWQKQMYSDVLRINPSTFDGHSAIIQVRNDKFIESARNDFFGHAIAAGRFSKGRMVSINDFGHFMRQAKMAVQVRQNVEWNRLALAHAKKSLSKEDFGNFMAYLAMYNTASKNHVDGFNFEKVRMDVSDKAGPFMFNGRETRLAGVAWNEYLTHNMYGELKKIKMQYKDVPYKDTFKSGLVMGVSKIFADNPKGITPENMIKELQKINSSGLKVLEEANVIGFMDFLKEKSQIKRENGKTEKLDVAEVERFLEANAITVRVERDPKFDVDTSSYAVGNSEHMGVYGTLAARINNKEWFPAKVRRGSHVEGELDTIVWTRFTIRDVMKPDGTVDKILYIEEQQAMNDAEHRNKAETLEAKGEEWKKQRSAVFSALARSWMRIGTGEQVQLTDNQMRMYTRIMNAGFTNTDSATYDAVRMLGANYQEMMHDLIRAVERETYLTDKGQSLRDKIGETGIYGLKVRDAVFDFFMRNASAMAEDGLTGTALLKDSVFETMADLPERLLNATNEMMGEIGYSNNSIFGEDSYFGPRTYNNESSARFVRDVVQLIESPEFARANPEVYNEWVNQRNNSSISTGEALAGVLYRQMSGEEDVKNHIMPKFWAASVKPDYAQQLRGFFEGYAERAKKALIQKGLNQPEYLEIIRLMPARRDKYRLFAYGVDGTYSEHGVAPEFLNKNNVRNIQRSMPERYTHLSHDYVSSEIELQMLNDFLKVPDEQLTQTGRELKAKAINGPTDNNGYLDYGITKYAVRHMTSEFIRNNVLRSKEEAMAIIDTIDGSQVPKSKKLLSAIASTAGGREFFALTLLKDLANFEDLSAVSSSNRRFNAAGNWNDPSNYGIDGLISFMGKVVADETKLSAMKALSDKYLAGDYYDVGRKGHLSELGTPSIGREQVRRRAQADTLRMLYEVAMTTGWTKMQQGSSSSKSVFGFIGEAIDKRRGFEDFNRNKEYTYPNYRVPNGRIVVDGISDGDTRPKFTDFKYVVNFKYSDLKKRMLLERGHERIGKLNDEVVDGIASQNELDSLLLKMSMKMEEVSTGRADKNRAKELHDIMLADYPKAHEILQMGERDLDLLTTARKAAQWTTIEGEERLRDGRADVFEFNPDIPADQTGNQALRVKLMNDLGERILGPEYFSTKAAAERQRLLKQPFLSSNEYIKISNRMVLRQAILSGVKRVVLTHPHDGGWRSGLGRQKGEYMYGKLNPEIMKKDNKVRGLDMRQMGFADIPTVLPFLETAFEVGMKKVEIEKDLLKHMEKPEQYGVNLDEYFYPKATGMAEALAKAFGDMFLVADDKLPSIRQWDSSLKQLTYDKKAIGPAPHEQYVQYAPPHFGISGQETHYSVMAALKSGLRVMDDNIGSMDKFQHRSNVLVKQHEHQYINLHDGLLQLFEHFYTANDKKMAQTNKAKNNVSGTMQRIRAYQAFRDLMLGKADMAAPDANKYRPLFDWADAVMADIDAQLKYARAIFESPEIQAGGLNAFIDRRGMSMDMTQIKPEAVNEINSGMTAFKPLDNNTKTQDVSLGTPNFRSKFISEYARNNHRLADAARIYVIEKEHPDSNKSNFTLTISPRGNKRLGMDSKDITVEAFADFGNMAGHMEIVSRDESGEYAELARLEMLKRFQVMGIDYNNLTGDFNKPVAKMIDGVEQIPLPKMKPMDEAELKNKGFVGEFAKANSEILSDFRLEEYRTGLPSENDPSTLYLYLKYKGETVGQIQVGLPSEKADRKKYHPHVFESEVYDGFRDKGFGKLLYSEAMQRVAKLGFTKLTGMQVDPWRRPERIRKAIAGAESTRKVGQGNKYPVAVNEWGGGQRYNIETDIDPNASYKPKATVDRTAWTERKEGNGLTVTSVDGYFIMLSKSGGYRLYSPQRVLIGVYKTEEEARKKAAKMAQ